jgi:hypothetical protein
VHELAPCSLTAGDRTVDGHVITVGDGTMTCADVQGAASALRVGDDVEVVVLDDVRGEVTYQGWVEGVGPETVQVADLELTSTLQKRQAARVRIAQFCRGIAQSPDSDSRSITFVVLDISAYGMRISTTAGLVEHDRIEFRFPTQDGPLALDAEVLRVQPTRTGTAQYGCRFVNLGDRETDALFEYVLRTQGEQRRTRLRP